MLKPVTYLSFILTLLSTVVLTACDDKDDSSGYPALQTELVEALTGTEKNVNAIRLDNGITYAVSQQIGSNVADTLYRCVCSFTYDTNNEKLSVYALTVIPSNFPFPTDTLPPAQSSDIKLISNWITPRYVNAYLSFQTTSQGTHQFIFVEDSVTQNPDGTSSAYVRLFHQRPSHDPLSYSQKQYVSLPTYYYHDKADTVHLEIGSQSIIALP